MFEVIGIFETFVLVNIAVVMYLLSRIEGALERINTREHANKIRDDLVAERLRQTQR